MSRRTYIHNEWTVTAGWDRPLHHLFLDISREIERKVEADETTYPDETVSETVYLFDNLDLPNPAMTFEQIKNTLADHKFPVPDRFLDDILLDAACNRGNVFEDYGTI